MSARLKINLVEATNLLQKNKLKKNNCFARIYLGNEKQKTKIIENSNDPKWNEIFIFDDLTNEDILLVNVYTENETKKQIIGSIQIKLRSLFKKGRIDTWYHIPAKVGLACVGQVHIILSIETQ